jgi:hypothetical protein
MQNHRIFEAGNLMGCMEWMNVLDGWIRYLLLYELWRWKWVKLDFKCWPPFNGAIYWRWHDWQLKQRGTLILNHALSLLSSIQLDFDHLLLHHWLNTFLFKTSSYISISTSALKLKPIIVESHLALVGSMNSTLPCRLLASIHKVALFWIRNIVRVSLHM